ncbi:PREDICTED: uncharacterized protein LOC109332552 [Lupinus angustifolius]|uniref:uncharacterized protein LOC109332552 n=1 Tax=Lupinus angustifolius TaxID=3871 RepID=UPI00092FD190|nr:PREDICTED: uncharacterized protein LOC109332552 [Lupinus angustifolius]
MANLPSTETEPVLPLNTNDSDIQSPFYLHPGESPDAILASPPLDGNNYHSWSRAMSRALSSKNKFKFVNGTINTPSPTSPDYDMWEWCNNIVVSWITRSLTQPISQSIVYIDNAHELWLDLRERFSSGDYFKMSDLLQEFHSIKQGDRAISNYFTDIKTLWEELETLRPMPSCTFSIKCHCGMFKMMKDQRENEYVICFLKGLNDEFNTVNAHILLMEPLPQINKAFSLLLQQKRQLSGSSNSKAFLNVAHDRPSSKLDNTQPWRSRQGDQRGGFLQGRGRNISRGYNTQRSSGTKVCTFCGRERHTVESCYFKHGFPPNFQSGKTRQDTRVINIATNSDQPHHKDLVPQDNTSGSEDKKFHFGHEQYEQLATLFKSIAKLGTTHNVNQQTVDSSRTTQNNPSKEDHPPSGTHTYWILDTGATDHVCPDLSLFVAHHNIRPITIGLPNGTTIQATIAGAIKLSDSITLHHVLYVPQFHYNLL